MSSEDEGNFWIFSSLDTNEGDIIRKESFNGILLDQKSCIKTLELECKLTSLTNQARNDLKTDTLRITIKNYMKVCLGLQSFIYEAY